MLANKSFFGWIQYSAQFMPIFLFVPLIISKLLKHKVSVFYPFFLTAEYLIWPLFFFFYPNNPEMINNYAYLSVYVGATYFFIARSRITDDKFAKYFSVAYLFCSIVIILNMISFMSYGLSSIRIIGPYLDKIVQAAYDGYFHIMSTIMVCLVILGWVAMYGSGNGGRRVRNIDSFSDYSRTNKVNLA